ncbi:MAG: argininosuccinate lyase [Xanthomonadales bacterium]|nr:argininosuccinate lyase [Xanthomonadales bacterium]
MSTPVWQRDDVQVDADVMAFLAGADIVLDREFIRHDIRASQAHAEGLARIGILDAGELAAISRELDALDAALIDGSFVLDERFEDGHSAIEAWLSERLGETGRRIHTGRSRNDQVLVATRLWLKDRLATLYRHCRDIAGVALELAARHAQVPMPGYTHLQRAVVSSLGHWHAAWAEAFIDNAVRARDTFAWLDANPLGTAAGYGVNLPLDREHSTRALGFARLQLNPAYAQLSRGKFELAAIEALAMAVLDLRRLAWDLSLFTTAEFGFVRMPARYSTGSSIMPNKRNPDVVELMRASYASVAAARTELEQLLSLPSGYQRDLQPGKGALVHGFGRGLQALALLPGMLADLDWDSARLRAAIEPSMYATDLAIELARDGVAFRDAYRQVADAVSQMAAGDPPPALAERSPEASITARVSPGACAALGLDKLTDRLAALPAHLPQCIADQD